jgi:hypothetical protein
MASSDPSDGGDEREVLSGLPNARPHRRSAKRDRPARGAAASAKGAPAAAKTQPKPKPRPKAKPAAPAIPAAGYATPRDDDGGGAGGADLIGTTVQAVGELAQIGLAAGGRALKSAFQRLPRP